MDTVPGSPADRLLTLFLIVAPVMYLVADTLYAFRGWDDATAGVVHVIAATAYLLVVIRVVTWTDGPLEAALLLVGVLGAAGNVAYGFNTIHVALGDTDLVDAGGAAALIKPYGLFFPLSLLLVAVALRRRAAPWVAGLIAVASVAWPVAHIANIGWLAVLVNVALVVAFSAVFASVSTLVSAPASAQAAQPLRPGTSPTDR